MSDTTGSDDGVADDRRAILDALRTPWLSGDADTTSSSSPTETAAASAEQDEPEITSWMDIIEDDDWLNEPDDSAEPTTVTPFPCPDVAADVRRAISDITSRPTNDYETHYQQGYTVFRTAGARLSQLIEAARAAGVVSTDDPRVAPLATQLDQVEALRAEHVERHEEYRALLHPVTGRYGRQIADDNRRGFADRQRINDEANRSVTDTFRQIGESNRAAAERRFDDWQYQFNSTW